MKIAYIVASLVQKGPVVVVRDLVNLMVANGCECIVLYFDEKDAMDFKCPTRKINFKEPIDFLDYDVVHSHSLRPDIYVSRFREYSGKVKYITTLHNYVFKDLSDKYNYFVAQIVGRYWMRCVSKLDVIVTLSKDAKKYYEKILTKDTKVTFAYNTRILDVTETLDNHSINELKTFKQNKHLIGFNGLLHKRKAVDTLIRALVSLPDYKLFIVGNGPLESELKALAKKCGVDNRCFFAGFRKNAHLYLPFYDIYALPSRSEGFPLALLEAAYFEKKCVASDLPILLETFPNEIEFFQLSNPSSIVDAILRADANNNLSCIIKNKFNECYSSSIMYERYHSIYIE